MKVKRSVWSRLGKVSRADRKPPRSPRESRCPDYDLADLTGFPPETLGQREEDHEVDAFILSLALAFNDLKGVFWFSRQLLNCTPDNAEEISAENGQWIGMRVQVARLLLSMTHEILRAIGNAHHRGILRHRDIRAALRLFEPEYREAWQRVLRAGKGNIDDAQLRDYLWTIRNKGTFHYNQSEDLLVGYRQFFLEGDRSPRNEHAFVSFGMSMQRTRFYFADAAVQFMYLGTAPFEKLFDAANGLLSPMNMSLRLLLEAFFVQRHRRYQGHAYATKLD